jgi:hypothetical protein
MKQRKRFQYPYRHADDSRLDVSATDHGLFSFTHYTDYSGCRTLSSLIWTVGKVMLKLEVDSQRLTCKERTLLSQFEIENDRYMIVIVIPSNSAPVSCSKILSWPLEVLPEVQQSKLAFLNMSLCQDPLGNYFGCQRQREKKACSGKAFIHDLLNMYMQ